MFDADKWDRSITIWNIKHGMQKARTVILHNVFLMEKKLTFTAEDGKIRKMKGNCVTMKSQRVSSANHVPFLLNRFHRILWLLIFMVVTSYNPFFHHHQLGIVDAAPYVLVTDNRPNCKRFLVPGHSTVVIHYISPGEFNKLLYMVL